jgi:hypothetical protein
VVRYETGYREAGVPVTLRMANAAGEYDLTLTQAREIIDAQVITIRESWNEVADLARLSTLERQAM